MNPEKTINIEARVADRMTDRQKERLRNSWSDRLTKGKVEEQLVRQTDKRKG